MDLKFDLMGQPSILVFLENLIVKLNFHKKIGFKKFFSILIYVSKIVMFEYDFMTSYELKYIGASAFYICLKIVE